MTNGLVPLGTTRLGITPTPNGVGFLVSDRVGRLAVPRLCSVCGVIVNVAKCTLAGPCGARAHVNTRPT